MLRLGTMHGGQGDAAVEGDEAAAVLYRQRQQISVSNLPRPADAIVIENTGLSEQGIVGPKRVPWLLQLEARWWRRLCSVRLATNFWRQGYNSS